MYFRHFGVNPTIETDDEPVSTFAADVDTASYTLARAYLARNAMPEEEAVRVEEFVNSFNYGYRPPEREAFAVQVEAFPSPNRKGYHVLHVGLKGKEIRKEQRKPASLIFTIDVSGSMNMENRLSLVKRALHLLVSQLDERDSVGIVVYGDSAHTVLEPTTADRKERILEAIDRLHPEGSTNVQAGLELAYQLAARHLRAGTANRVIVCSDGVANNGITDADAIFATVKQQSELGITLTAVGFGMGNYNDVLMERLADTGNGHYAYVDRLDEARRIFVEQLTGTLEVIAKDVKIQLEFDPRAVARYRLLGFENRMLKKQDFADDRIDAGELGAGHSVTAIYEVKLREERPTYFATLRVRFKQPDGRTSSLVEKRLPSEIVRDSYLKTAGPTRVSMVAAAFAEKLRGSYWARNLSYDDILRMWEQIPEPLRQRKEVGELRELVQKARSLDRRGDKFEKDLPLAMMDFDRIPVLK
ncbi:MAG: von Willebrand factor type A domain-containing protein [Myxococcales bacterium]|nr:von Willebrand factor type A domain-containing protein [Myxococcales bacterium]